MKPSLHWILAPALVLFASIASAEFHTYQIQQIFTNASGTVQFIVMHESQGSSIEYFWMGNHLRALAASGNKDFVFPNNLPVQQTMCNPYYGCGDSMTSMMPVMPTVTSTANTDVLIATQGFAALGIVTPDYVIPNGFIPVGERVTINYAGVDQVTCGPLPTDGVTAVGRSCAMIPNVATNFSAQSASVAAVAAGIELNQHGLTGSYFQQTTNGQGVQVEIYPDQIAPGTGTAFLSWFTQDTVAGGAERERWYTVQGPVMTGQPSASLTIYQNVGGNFDAAPVTNGQPVGTATLSFDTCTSGRMSYSFSDGTGRMGSMSLARLTQNVTCSTSGARPTNPDFALSGNYFAQLLGGQGLTVEINPNNPTLFGAWYTYAPNGAASGAAGQRWYTLQPTTSFTPGSRSIAVTIYQTTGGIFDTPPPAGQQTVAVGTGTISFQSCTAATLSFNFTGGSSSGMSGSISLSRVGPVPSGCTG
jgi:hypothetical protein